jgi:hypothetical protein
LVAIVSSDGPANIGDLFVFLLPIAILVGCGGFAGANCQTTASSDLWLALYWRRVLAEFGIDRLEGHGLDGDQLATNRHGQIAKPEAPGARPRHRRDQVSTGGPAGTRHNGGRWFDSTARSNRT